MTHTVKRNFLFWLTVAFLHVVIATPAFAQMQGSTNYSDSWGDSNYVYGSGVTDSPYNNYNHTFRAVTTMNSPNGRVSSTDTGYGSYAAAYVSLLFDENDLGLYAVDTDHFDYCPIVFQEIFVGHSGAAVKVGITILCYNFSYFDTVDTCYFVMKDPCPVTRCKNEAGNVYSRPKYPGYNCPNKVAIKYRWVEKQDGCTCHVTCTKSGSDTPIYDPETCNCTEFSIP